MPDLTPVEVRTIADAAADSAVRKTLMQLGIDTADPRAFAEFRKDMNHIRAWRMSTETVKKHSLIAAVTTIVAAAVGYGIFLLTGGRFPS